MVGKITISVEIELAWGGHDLDEYEGFQKSISKNAQKERYFLKKLLQLCSDNGIPLTFDIVGHLFLEECSGNHLGPHPEGWFDNDPGTDYKNDPQFYAPDIVDMIRKEPIDHEICTHTFSHIPCGEVSSNVVAWELEKVTELHKSNLDQDVSSLVPPRHSPPPENILTDQGIEIIREPWEGTNSSGRLEYLYNELFGNHPIRAPKIENGIVKSYSTPSGSLNVRYLPLGQSSPNRVFQFIPLRIRKKLHKRYLINSVDAAIAQDSYVHLWTHLNDISNKHQMKSIEDLIKFLSDKKENRAVDIIRMDELNNVVRKRKTLF